MLVNITKTAKQYSSKLTITQVESIFKKFDLEIDKKNIKEMQKKGFLPELNSVRFYNYNHVIIIYVAHILDELIKEDIIKKYIQDLFSMDIDELINFYDVFYKNFNNKTSFENNENELYKLLYLSLTYKNSFCI